MKSFPVLSQGFEIETEMTIHALDKNLHVENLPVTYRDRPQGSESKLNTYSDGFKVLKTIFRLYKDYRPLPFFGMIGLLLLVISFVLFAPVLVQYIFTGLVPRFPTMIASGIIGIVAMLSFMCGLILDTVSKKERQNFELELNRFAMLFRAMKQDKD